MLELFAPSLVDASAGGAFAEALEREARLENVAVLRSAARGPHALVAVVESSLRRPMRFTVEVEAASPHRFVKFDIAPAPHRVVRTMTWEELRSAEPAAAVGDELRDGSGERLGALVSDHRGAQRLPGILAAVADAHGRLQWVHSEGVAGVDPVRAPSASMALRIGSISKTMTAVAVLQLVERGLVDLDAPVGSALTSIEVRGCDGVAVTPRHLLTHTSGLTQRSGFELGVDEGERVPALPEFYAGGLSSATVPGTTWAYSNDAFALLGQLVTDVTGEPFATYMARHVFDPLGMTRTSSLRDDRVAPQLFEGLDLELDDVVPAPFLDIVPLGAGSVFSTLDDMARYGAAILGQGANASGRVLAADTFERMLEPQPVQVPLPNATMGLGWLTLDVDGVRVHWHNGGWPGANSELAVVPSRGVSVLVFANTMGERLDDLCFSLVREVVSASAGAS